MFGFPIVISIIQMILMVTFFRYDTPKVLKQRGLDHKLEEMMKKMY